MIQVRRRGMLLHSFPALAVVNLHPVVLAIFDLSGALEGLREQLTKVVVIWGVFEAEIPDVAEVFAEFFWETLAKVFNRRGLLLLADLLVLLLVRGSFQTLPRKATSEEVHEYMAEGL